MATEGRKAVKFCERCIKHEGEGGKSPLHPIVATCPLDLINIDYIMIEVSGDSQLKTQPTLKNVLVVTDHFTRHAMAFITKDQKARTITEVLHKEYFAIFKAPACMMRDLDPNFTSNIIAELFTLFGVQQVRTTLYHPQSNGKTERFHQTLT